MKKENFRFGTRAIHAGQPPDAQTGAVMTPVYLTSTYAQSSPGEHKGYDYSRADNPTRTAYEQCLASLEHAQYGLAFASGLSAIDAIARLFKNGDHIVCCDDVYGGTFRLFDKVLRNSGMDFTFSNCENLSEVESAFRPNTKLLWLESPTNPLLKVLDIQTLCEMAHKKNILVAVDNTFLSPYFQHPLALGADLVVHSVTKYLNGHSDIIGGAIMTSNANLYEQLKFLQKAVGAVPSPMECFLAMRGIKTLHVRMDRHSKNALEIARFLEKHHCVEKVIYPGLESHACQKQKFTSTQMKGWGGMLTFYIKGGEKEARRFLEKVKIFTLAESLGGVESLIEHPAIMTHASVPPENRKKLGILDNMIRVSVGIEDVEDLIEDLKNALS